MASLAETCTSSIGTSKSSASEMARWVASRSTTNGRDVRVELGRRHALQLQPLGQPFDAVGILGMDHEHGLLAPAPPPAHRASGGR